jgi:hypothetical protein
MISRIMSSARHPAPLDRLLPAGLLLLLLRPRRS